MEIKSEKFRDTTYDVIFLFLFWVSVFCGTVVPKYILKFLLQIGTNKNLLSHKRGHVNCVL